MNRLSILQKHIAGNDYKKLQLQVQEQVGLIKLNSPKDLNCLSTIMQQQIVRALNEHYANPQIKTIVICSTHQKVFCAGADIKSFMKNDFQFYLKHQIFNIIEDGFRNIKIPVIAAVNGKALGGGFELALLCDIILCSDKASFALPQINLGLIPGIGGTQRLTKAIGQKLTMQSVMTGDPIQAKRANQLGLAYLLVQGNFQENVLKYASRIASKSMSALITGKRAVKQSSDMPLSQGLQFEKSTFYPLMATKGAKQGITAFLEKRKANFTGI